ncbi:GTP pyrophosphokinase [Bacillus cereus]
MESTNPKKDIDELRSWYQAQESLYSNLSQKVATIIKEFLDQNNITYYAITNRAKGIDSFIEKAEKVKYTDPKNQIKDLAGIRIITFVSSEVDSCSNLIKPLFKMDDEHSTDKREDLGTDKVGYRSVHYVGELNEDRLRLPEFSPFAGMTFEIQIRTILEHAWADISHDRNYKFGGVLPPDNDIQRRFSLAAATLELVDREFNSLAMEIDKYKEKVHQQTSEGDFEITINTLSLNEYMHKLLKDQIENSTIKPLFHDEETTIIEELNSFGIHTLEDLKEIIGDDINKFIHRSTTFLGLLRDIMIIQDADKYFSECWNNNWDGISADDYTFYAKNGVSIDRIIDEYDIYLDSSNTI